MPKTYDQTDVSFSYPDNWELTDNDANSIPRTITVQSPKGGAFWALHLYTGESEPEELVREAVGVMSEEYEDFEASFADETYLDEPCVVSTMHFYCLDFLVQAKARSFFVGDDVGLLITQAESRDFDNMELVFDAITASLLGFSNNSEVTSG